ncbi:MAG: DUF6753 family protein [Leptolyngbyaceae cyanobacterium bins.302]|nr:DUF6753 family protein [Leptolyngbyaceae cyanobacterium bins.302]
MDAKARTMSHSSTRNHEDEGLDMLLQDENELDAWDLEDEFDEDLLEETITPAKEPPKNTSVNASARPISTIATGVSQSIAIPLLAQHEAKTASRKQVSPSTHNALARLLKEEPESVKAKVWELISEYDLDSDDPAFTLMTATGRLQVLLKDSPAELKAMFEQWQADLYGAIAQYREGLKQYEQTAVKAQQTAIAHSVHTLLRKTAIDQFMHQLSAASTILAGTLLVAAAAIGGGVGWAIAQQQQNQLDPTRLDPQGKRQLTLEQANRLQWAASPEGKLAQNLTQWNKDLLDRDWRGQFACEQQARKLGMTLKLGTRQAKSGFCVLWVKPPQDSLAK